MKKILVLSVFFFGLFNTFAQNSTTANLPDSVIIKEPGYLYYSVKDKHGAVSSKKIDLMEMVDVFVEFKDEPMFVKMKNRQMMKAGEQLYQQTVNQLIEDVAVLTKRLSKKTAAKINLPSVKKSFHKLVNGVNIEVPRAILGSLLDLDYVKNVYKNVEYKIIDESVPGTESSLYKPVSDTAGKGIVIGIIDTGIDYMHPALGGGFGPGYKVIGGYDILDEDDDPMDTYGHGTHVAGIAAGNNDTIKGVAPGASLMAFKIESETKITTMATVIEGVERAMDPNNDGDYSDRVDIVNMSLGFSGGSPEDPVSVAVNNAVSLGTVFCISAGNSENNFTICSPGNAPDAIGVGAKDTSDNTVYFSSKGPVSKTYSIKPDVIAPGTSILSSIPGGSYAKYSGTSMASPYVAGVCAVIKSIHRDWTPAQIKSAIMSSADKLDESVFSQGSGIVNLNKALNVNSFITPSSLSFGYCNTESNMWNKADTLIIKNISAKTINYSIADCPSCINIMPASFSIGPGDSIQLIVNLSVDNSSTPYSINFNNYNGVISLLSDDEVLHLPWAFVKAPRMVINYNHPVADLFLMDTSKVYWAENFVWSNDSKTAELLLPNNTYSLYSLFYDIINDSTHTVSYKIHAKENIVFNNAAEFNISTEETKNEVSFKGVDIRNNILSENRYWLGLFSIYLPEDSPLEGVELNLSHGEKVYLSDMSARHLLFAGELLPDINNNKEVYVTNYEQLYGISSGIVYANNSAEYNRYKLKLKLSPFVTEHNIMLGSALYQNRSGWTSVSANVYMNTSYDKPEWEGSLYIVPPINPDLYFTTALNTDIEDDGMYFPWIKTNPFVFKNDSLGFSLSSITDYYIPQNQTFTFGMGIYTPSILPVLFSSSQLYMFFNSYGICGDERVDDEYRTSYNLYNSDNKVIKSGTVYEARINSGIKEIPEGRYLLELKNRNYSICGQRGSFTYNCRFSTSGSRVSNYSLEPVAVYNSQGEVTERLNTGEKASLLFKVSDIYKCNSISLFVKPSGSDIWNSVPVKKTSENNSFIYSYSADLSACTNYDSTSLDLKISMVAGGDSINYVWAPVVGIGSFSGALDISEENTSIPVAYNLYNNYPNPFNNSTIIKFDLPSESKVKIELYNILGEKIQTLRDETFSAGTHTVQFNAENLASGVYIYNLTVEGRSFYRQSKKMVLLK